MRFDDDRRRWRLARRHLLVDRGPIDVADLADRLVALHSSDPATVYLAVAARDPETTVDSVARALYDERTVIRHHAMRRTLWVMTPEVCAETHAACTRKIADAERNRNAKLFGRSVEWLAGAGDRAVDVVAHAIGPISTKDVGAAAPDLSERITVAQGKNYEGTITLHTKLLLQAAFDGRIVRTRPAGTWIGSQYGWTTPDRWIDIGWDAHDAATGHLGLVRRWLWTFGPGTLDDLVWWTGTTKTAVRRSLEAVEADEVELDGGETGFVLPGDDRSDDGSDDADPGPWVALLPGLDPTPMGWKRRDWYLSPDVAERVVDRNGNIGPTVWVDGRIVGGWVQRDDGSIAHDADVPAGHRDRFDAEVSRVQRFVGDTRVSVRFPSPNQKPLLADV